MPDLSRNKSERSAYRAGAVDTKLAEHTDHFVKLNGSVQKLESNMDTVLLMLQGIRDSANSAAAAVITTAAALETQRVTQAAALESERVARKDEIERKYEPWQKVLFVLGGIATFVAAVVAALVTIQHWSVHP